MIPKPAPRQKKPRRPLRKVNTRTARKQAMARAVKAFNLFIRTQDPVCFTCGRDTRLTCGHLITAKNESTRFDEENCRTQCAACNYRHEYNPEIFTELYIREMGAATYLALVQRSHEIKKHTTEELNELTKFYTEKTNALPR